MDHPANDLDQDFDEDLDPKVAQDLRMAEVLPVRIPIPEIDEPESAWDKLWDKIDDLIDRARIKMEKSK